MDDTSNSNRRVEQCIIQIEDETGDTVINDDVAIVSDEKEKDQLPSQDAELSDKQRQEHIMNMLTERQPETVINGRRKYLVYFEQFKSYRQAPPESPPIEYSAGNRNDFVRLVFFLVFCMLLVTFAFTFMVYMVEDIRNLMHKTTGGFILLGICLVVMISINYVFCCSSCARKIPCNYVLLWITTICMSYICAFITASYLPNVVLGALFSTLAITGLCLGLAFTSIDFTKFILIVVVAGVAVSLAMLFAVILSFAFGIKLGLLSLILLIISALISSVSMIIEFQMILGGKSIELGEDDYAYGAFLVYISIIDMFLKMLRIIAMFIDLDELL